MALGAEGALMAKGAIGSRPLLILFAVTLRGVILRIMRSGWGVGVTFVAVISLMATAAHLWGISGGLSMLDRKPFRMRHLNPVTFLTAIATVTGSTPAVGWLYFLAVLLNELWCVVLGA